jgi:competence protein ComEC
MQVRALFMRPAGAPFPGGWDIQFDAFFAGIGGFGYALGPAEHLEATAGTWSAWLAGVQQTIIARVHAALPGPEGRIAAGLMVGGATAISPADAQAWRDSGLYHLLSISGLHLAIAMGLVFATLRFGLAAWEWGALHLPVKAIAAVAALVSGGFYTLLTGAQVPMLRSFAMAALVTLAVVAGRRALSLRAWALAMAGVVVLAPWTVVGVSFQMSFAAVLALIAGFEALRPVLSRIRGEGGWPRSAAAYGVGLVLTSALAGTAAAPFAAYHFGQMQVYYVLANFLAVPLTTLLVMPAAVLSLLLMPLGWEQVALAPMGWGVAALGTIARTVAAWPKATLRVAHILPWGLVVFSVGFAWLALLRGRVRLVGVPVIMLGLASALLYRPPDILVSGDARLIGLRTPEGLHVLRTQGGSGFVLEAWLALLAEREALPLPESGRGDAHLSCEAGTCLFKPHEGNPNALIVLRAPAPRDTCDAALVVSPEPLRLECDKPVPVIDRFSVWRDGAQAAWLAPGGIHILTDREVRGTRPWVVPLTTRQRTPRGVPMPMAAPDQPSAGQEDPIE